MGKLKEKWRNEGIENKKLPEEDTCKVNRWLDEGISVIRRDYRKKEAESIESAGRTYFTC